MTEGLLPPVSGRDLGRGVGQDQPDPLPKPVLRVKLFLPLSSVQECERQQTLTPTLPKASSRQLMVGWPCDLVPALGTVEGERSMVCDVYARSLSIYWFSPTNQCI